MSEKLPAKLGRRKLLTPEIVEKAKAYLVYDFQNVGDLVTSAVGLAQYLGVTKSTIYLWAEGDDDLSLDFSDTLRACVEKQEKMLISGGLGGAYNSTITKLMMTNHGYSDKPEPVEQSEDEITSVTVRIKNAAKKPRD